MKTAIEIYNQSNGEVTVKYYKELTAAGPIGEIAMNLFRAQKCSDRAKQYRKGSWKADAYARKTYSIEQLCEVMDKYGAAIGYQYGWKIDHNIVFGAGYYDDDPQPSWVFYIDLPVGQVSFHSKVRYRKGPDYPGEWCGEKGISLQRILLFCEQVQTKQLHGNDQ